MFLIPFGILNVTLINSAAILQLSLDCETFENLRTFSLGEMWRHIKMVPDSVEMQSPLPALGSILRQYRDVKTVEKQHGTDSGFSSQDT